MKVTNISPQKPRYTKLRANDLQVGTVARPSINASEIWVVVKKFLSSDHQWVNVSSGYLGYINGYITGEIIDTGTVIKFIVEGKK